MFFRKKSVFSYNEISLKKSDEMFHRFYFIKVQPIRLCEFVRRKRNKNEKVKVMKSFIETIMKVQPKNYENFQKLL